MNLGQIHTEEEDMFDPSLGRVSRSKVKVTRDKKWPIYVVLKWLEGLRYHLVRR